MQGKNNPRIDNVYPARKNPRLKEFDYSSAGYYFITICANDRRNLFGEIGNSGKLDLNSVGLVAKALWSVIPQHFPNVGLDEFIVMPNHIHGVITIRGPGSITEKPQPMPKIGTIVGSYKSSVSRQLNRLGVSVGPIWQRGYYEHIIRNETDLASVREYIAWNPVKWQEDPEFRRSID